MAYGPMRAEGDQAVMIERKRGRVLDPGTGRWYKDGFAPFQLMRPIPATCSRCGGEARIYPAGLACVNCTPAEHEADFYIALERQRVRAGYVPLSEE
jgi:hypothetical protein